MQLGTLSFSSDDIFAIVHILGIVMQIDATVLSKELTRRFGGQVKTLLTKFLSYYSF